MRYILLLVLLAGCGVKPEKTDVNIERYENLVKELNKINSSTYDTKSELKTELKENTELLKSVKEIAENIQKSLCEDPKPIKDENFVEVQSVEDHEKEVEQIFKEEVVPKTEPKQVVKNTVLLVKHTPTDFNCSWCNVWDKRHKKFVNCDVNTVREHSSVGRKKGKGYPYFDLVVNGKIIYGWVGSVSHQKMNAIINQYKIETNRTPSLKWSVGTARNPWRPTKDEVISHLVSHHNYNSQALKSKDISELIEIHNELHNANRW